MHGLDPCIQGSGRFPSLDFVAKLIERGATRFSAHLCGGRVREVIALGATQWERRGSRIEFAPNSLFGPDKAELLPCSRELLPCSVA